MDVLIVVPAVLLIVAFILFTRGPVVQINGDSYFDTSKRSLLVLQKLRTDISNMVRGHALAERRFNGMIMGDLPSTSTDLAFVRVWTKEFRIRTDLNYKTLLYIARHEVGHLKTPNWLSHGSKFRQNV